MYSLKFQQAFFFLFISAVLFVPNLVAQDISETIREGQAALQSQDWDTAIKAFTKITDAKPQDADALFALGYALHGAGEIDKALPYHQKAASLGSGDVKATALYNIACVYSRKKKSDKAFDALEKAVEAGFSDTTQMKADTDLANIHKDKRFAELIERVNNPLIGRWVADKGSRAGTKIKSERLPTMIVTSKTMSIGEGDQAFVFEYKIDKTKSPMKIDLTTQKSPMGDGQKAKGIIEFDRKSLKLCYNPSGSRRPKEFESTDENKFHFFSLNKKAANAGGDIGEWVVGDWKCTKGLKAGDDIDEARMATVITFTEDMIKIPIDENSAFEMSYKIDASKNPVQIDMKIEAGPAPAGTPALGILKRDGDKFMLCYDALGGGRPEKFESTGNNNFFYFEMKRQ